MALKQNQRLIAQMPLRHRGGAITTDRALWGRTELRNQTAGQGVTSQFAAVPSGHLAPSAWVLPYKSGALASRNSALGVASGSASGSLGVNGEAAASGLADATATGGLVSSGEAASAGVATTSGGVQAALIAAGDAAASASASAGLEAIGLAAAASASTGSASADLRANGFMAGASIVGAADVLTSQAISSEILDSQVVESGLTVRQTLRLIARVQAAKTQITPGAASTATVVFRDLGDTKDAIVATMAGSERTGVTIDPA